MNKEELNDEYYPDYKATVNPVEELRDKFAMAALSGLLANVRSIDDVITLSLSSYEIADNMMKARGESNGSV